jgi:hypothetical protein
VPSVRQQQGQGLDETVSPDAPEVKQLWAIANKALAEEDRLFQILTEAEARHDKAGARGTADAEYEINLARGAYSTARATSLKAVEQANLGRFRNPDLDVERVDPFTTETPETFTPAPAPPVSREVKSAYEELGADPKTGRTIEELQASEQAELGTGDPELVAELREAQAEGAAINQVEEGGYQIADCIWRVTDGN